MKTVSGVTMPTHRAFRGEKDGACQLGICTFQFMLGQSRMLSCWDGFRELLAAWLVSDQVLEGQATGLLHTMG